jgi:hypothetical protein
MTAAIGIAFVHIHKHIKYLTESGHCGHEAMDTLDAWVDAGYEIARSDRNVLPKKLSEIMPRNDDPDFEAWRLCPDGYEKPATPCSFQWFNNNDVKAD